MSEQFNLQNLFDSVQLSVSAYITRYGMNMQVTLTDNDNPNEIWLYGDLYRLKIVLSNLVKNACVHSGGDKVNISVSRVESANGDQQLTFTVTDNGRGIPTDQVDELFSPYARGTTDADGSGLGLHIARSWIEELGGTLRYIPSDIGAIFELLVTLKSSSAQSVDGFSGSGNNDNDASRAAVDTSQLSVLFVEDDTMIQMVGKKLLSKMFAQVDTASDGVQALNQLRQRHYDLVLTDYFMPNMNGLELIQELRSTGYEGVLYACTAASLGTELNDLMNAGANDVFTKPLTLNKLMACLANDADLIQRANQPMIKGMKNMQTSCKTLHDLLQQNEDKALLLIDLETGEIQGTEKWRKLNAVPMHESLSREILNQTIPDHSRDEYVSYSKAFFKSPVDSAPVVLEIKLCGLDGREFMGRITSEKVVIDNQVFAFTELEEI
jgi:CheY-like chemotaxis protein/anti-sigma regulatory factor (Ser/Thr protein kinase)